MCRVGQNHLYVHIYTPYMTVYLVISLPKLPYIHRIYMVLANLTHVRSGKRWLIVRCCPETVTTDDDRLRSGARAHTHTHMHA